MDITQDRQLQKFLKAKQRKQSTIGRYIKEINYYTSYLNKTPTELIREAREDQTKHPWMDEREISDHFDSFVDYLQNDREFGNANIKNIMTIIKMFYRYFEVKTPEKEIKGVPKSYYVLYEDLPQYQDMQRLFQFCNVQYEALFTFMASTAMNYADASSITVKELIRAVNYYFKLSEIEETEVNSLEGLYEISEKYPEIIPVWRMWRIKTDQQHITYSSPESLHNILFYMTSHPPENLEVPLFRARGKQTRLGYEAVRVYLLRQNKNLGWKGKQVGNYSYVTSKSFRVFFANELDDEGLDYRKIRLMMGHKMAGVDRNYFKKNDKNLLEEYKKGLHRITFKENITTVERESEALQEMKEINQQILQELKEHKLKIKALENRDKIREELEREENELNG